MNLFKRNRPNKPFPPGGVEVIHAFERSKMIVVDVAGRPYAEPLLCPTCQITHRVKAVHLWLDDRGVCVVSSGVLDDLKLAGMPHLRVGGFVKNPPTLTVGHHVNRAEVDYRNRSQRIYKLDGYNS
jgi:hypothetical protein